MDKGNFTADIFKLLHKVSSVGGGGPDDKWEYMGYGIWENSDTKKTGGQSNISSSANNNNASSATQELDDLMVDLNHFQLKSPAEKVGEICFDLQCALITSSFPQPSGSGDLDHMLGDLREEMDKQGVRTTQKGVCSACQKPIAGNVVTALGRTWHPEVRKVVWSSILKCI